MPESAVRTAPLRSGLVAATGIEIERIQPAHPEQTGRHERMHLTLKKKRPSPPRRTHGTFPAHPVRARHILGTAPACFQARSRRTEVKPLHVVSKAKSTRSAAKRSFSRSTIRAAAVVASSGLSGERPLAIGRHL